LLNKSFILFVGVLDLTEAVFHTWFQETIQIP